MCRLVVCFLLGKDPVVTDVGERFIQLCIALGAFLVDVAALLFSWSLLIVWLALCLWGINWQKVWGVLARGAWLPAVLILIVTALVWSRIAPGDCSCLGFVTVGNFWWQLGYVGLLAAITLFCGWVQGYFGWQPVEIDLDAVAVPDTGHEHPVGTLHGHEAFHIDDHH